MKMAVIGCGLIGGSMALSWKRAGIVDEVIAFGHNPATLQKALDKGAADAVTTSMEEAVKDADIVAALFRLKPWSPFLLKWHRSLSPMPWLPTSAQLARP